MIAQPRSATTRTTVFVWMAAAAVGALLIAAGSWWSIKHPKSMDGLAGFPRSFTCSERAGSPTVPDEVELIPATRNARAESVHFDDLGGHRLRMAVTFAGPPPPPLRSTHQPAGLEQLEFRLGVGDAPELVVSTGYDAGRAYWTIARSGQSGDVVKVLSSVIYQGNTMSFTMDLDGLIEVPVAADTPLRLQVEAIRVTGFPAITAGGHSSLAVYPTRDCPAYSAALFPTGKTQPPETTTPILDDPY